MLLRVGVEDEGAVVAGVVDRARTGCAVVGAAGGERGGVDGVDAAPRSRAAEGDVDAADRRDGRAPSIQTDRASGPGRGAAEADRARSRFHQRGDPERLQRLPRRRPCCARSPSTSDCRRGRASALSLIRVGDTVEVDGGALPASPAGSPSNVFNRAVAGARPGSGCSVAGLASPGSAADAGAASATASVPSRRTTVAVIAATGHPSRTRVRRRWRRRPQPRQEWTFAQMGDRGPRRPCSCSGRRRG